MALHRILGSLKSFRCYNETPHIGTRFPDKSVQLSKILQSSEMTRDLAKLVAHRGVVFFTDQDITIEEQKLLAARMGELTGRPASSTLHKHPISEETSELGGEVSVISSMGGIARTGVDDKKKASEGWHADITFENIPADYSILKMHTLPREGGDTLWASGYEAYDRLSVAFRSFLSGLTALHEAPAFVEMARENNIRMQDPRGSPHNTGTHLTAFHPVVRTHPLTGFNAIFTNKFFSTRIPELSFDESSSVLDYLHRHVAENHDMQVRYRWGLNDVAIWDNRATVHTATNDYNWEPREGNRVVGVGDRPFFDPNGRSRREAMEEDLV